MHALSSFQRTDARCALDAPSPPRVRIVRIGVNADRIRTGLLTDDMISKRAKARGVSEAEYMGGNLLGREVRARDVAEAFVYLATAHKTTGAVITVDGGNVAAALR